MVVHLNVGLRSINRNVVYFYVGCLFLEDKLTGLVMEAAFVLPLWEQSRLPKTFLSCGTVQRLSNIEY